MREAIWNYVEDNSKGFELEEDDEFLKQLKDARETICGYCTMAICEKCPVTITIETYMEENGLSYVKFE